MFRTSMLFVLLALAQGLTSPSVSALGLGGMRTQSALNQPFYAEIELFDVKTDELDTVKVRLASADAFRDAGAERPHFLTRLRFTPMLGRAGQPIVQVTSREPIREPYLDFLVEVLWPEGRMVKEYTVLMDPPTRGSRSAPNVSMPNAAAPVRRAPPTARTTPPPPRTRPQAPAPRQSQPAAETAAASQPESRPVSPPVPPPMPQPVPRQAANTEFPLHYGPVRNGVGLWRIARRMAPPGASVAQTAMALYRNNQDAFVRGNINLLAVNSDLYIPTAEELFALDANTAERQFRDAMAGRKVTAEPITDIPAQPRLTIATAPAGSEPMGNEGDEREPDEGSASEAAPSSENVGALEEDLLLVREASESNRQETTELRDRIHNLEAQLNDIRRLLELRNEQLAQIQAAVRDPESARALGLDADELAMLGDAELEPVPKPADADASRELLPSTSAQATDGPISDLEPVEVLTEIARPTAEQQAIDAALSAPNLDTSAPETPAKPLSQLPDDVKQTLAIEIEPTPDNVPEESGVGVLGFLSTTVNRTPLWAVGAGVGTLLLGGLGWLAYRRRAQNVPNEPDEVFIDIEEVLSDTDGSESQLSWSEPSPVTDQQVAEDSRTLDLESLSEPSSGAPADTLSDVQGEGISEGEEIGVLAEADIYILYGRYREAEEILLEALRSSPAQPDLRYKLAEAYIGSDKQDALAQLAKHMKSAGEDRLDPEKWLEIQQVVDQLAPALEQSDGADLAAASEVIGADDSSDGEDSPHAQDDELRVSVQEMGLSTRGHMDTSDEDIELDLDLDLDLNNLDDPDQLDDTRSEEPLVSAALAAESAQESAPTAESSTEIELPEQPQSSVNLEKSADSEPPGQSELSVELKPPLASELPMESEPSMEPDPPTRPELLAELEPSTESESPAEPPTESELSALLYSHSDPSDESAVELHEQEVAESRPSSEGASQSETDDNLDLDLDALASLINSSQHAGTSKATNAAGESAGGGSDISLPPLELDFDELTLSSQSLADAEGVNKDGMAQDVESTEPPTGQWDEQAGLWNEVSTKMDLARAYVEMEDPEAARAILDDIVQEGNEEQQAEAKVLLERLG